MALRSHELRKAHAAELEERSKRLAQVEPIAQSEKLERVETQLARVDAMFEKCKTPRDMDMLARAKERLLNAWALLTGFPRPGVRKVTRRGAIDAMPEPSVSHTEAQPH